MEGLIFTLLGGAILGLTALAYKNPQHYARLWPWLMASLNICLLLGMIYYIGYSMGANDAWGQLKENPQQITFKETPFPFSGFHALLGIAAALFYSVVLSFLPNILGIDPSPPKTPPVGEDSKRSD